MLWLLAFVPVVFVAAKLKPETHTVLFILSVLAIVPLVAGSCHRICCRKTGDAAGGMLNATQGS
jgi:Ca2+:H+ antiporter